MLRRNSRHLSSSFILTSLLLGTAIACGCSKQETLPSEPSGGNWAPVLLVSSQLEPLASPPEAKSEQQRVEIEELLEFQKRRTPQMEETVAFWNVGACVRWNEIARELVAKYRTDAPLAARAYALLSVAQYDGLVIAWSNKYFHNRPTPQRLAWSLMPRAAVSEDPGYPSADAVVAAASSSVLAYLYPNEAKFLEGKVKEHEESRLWAGVSFRSDIKAGDVLGRNVADLVIQRARQDGSDTAWAGNIAPAEGKWHTDANIPVGYPLWGEMKPWLIASGTKFRAPPPPPYGSPEFKAQLAEVRQISGTRSSEQARMAALWIDGPGSYTPPGRWNKIVADLILKYRLNEIRAARAFALTNMAMLDASIACWETKYHYLQARPSQIDPSITTPVGVPNDPAYTSSHSAFSGAGSQVLGFLFPAEAGALQAKAEEVSISGLYGGIYYRTDVDAGLTQGRAVAKLAIVRGRTDGSP